MPKKKKIKVFLGGYTNCINAQNLNCRSLAQHLDKSKFEVLTLSLYSGTLPSLEGVRVFNCFRPHKLSAYLGYLWGVWNADVAYLPKGELPQFRIAVTSFFRRKNFITVEGILDDEATANAERIIGVDYLNYYNGFQQKYSITAFMKQYNEAKKGLQTSNQILYLGTDTNRFLFEKRIQEPLTKVLMVGNDLLRKGVRDYFLLAAQFSDLEFHLVGSGNNKMDVKKELESKRLTNVVYHGMISQKRLSDLLKKVQLHVFPSRSEGFPKVTLETACAGVPSLVYSDYGASEWITDNKNGFVVDTLDEMKSVISILQEDSDKLHSISKSAIALGKSFDWKEKVKDWERVIEQLANA